jgi:ribonucleoside-triphosphate reductase
VFIGEPDIYSSCCRLSNNIKKAGGLGFQNSFGVGGLSLGSHRVAGLNLARISLLEKDNENILEEDIEMLHKILYAHRKLLKEKISKGVMPLYTSEWISINRQYSTIGITACNQYVANKGLDIKTEEGINCIHRVLKTIETKIEEWQAAETEEFCIYNLEAIPAESVAVRLAQSDRILGYNDKYEIYSNQYIDLMEDCPVYERFKVQGQLDQLTSGGNILHCNVDGEKPLTPEQYEKIIDLAKDCKVKYFGINYAYSECAKQHYTIGKNKKCPICGEPIVETWCRVVGFITPKSAFNPVRRDYEFDRRVFYESEEVEKATEKEKVYANC